MQAIMQDYARVHPSDWPGPGPIDLKRQDLPHASSALEWWYVNAHLEDALGRPFSLFASFFQIWISTDPDTGAKEYAHALTWALIDARGERYVSESLVDRDAAPMALARLDRGFGPREPRLRRALREVLEAGKVPAPDHTMATKGRCDPDALSLDFDGRTFEKLADGRYRLRLHDAAGEAGCDLVFSLSKPVVRHGDEGVVAGNSPDEMFYYFCPRCEVEGSIRADGVDAPIVSGSAWYDHEFGGGEGEYAPLRHVAWNWLSTQLDNGCELTVYDLYEGAESRGHFAVVIDREGGRRVYRDFTLSGADEWTSTRTFTRYPTRWRLSVPEAAIELEAVAAFPSQEFITFLSKSAFWEGRMSVTGVMGGEPVSGPGFVERANFGGHDTLDEFFAAVSRETRASVEKVLPAEPGVADVRRLVWGEDSPEWSRGVSPAEYRDSLIRPIRAIADRGGKSWRSYCWLACCDAVGGDSTRLGEWLALPELLHVGSLMVDDIQDRSTVRRGGAPAHETFGVGPTINAGNLCYFLPHLFFESAAVSDPERLHLYDLYFRVLRAAHAGQGLDLAGADDVVATALETGDGHELLERVLAVHRLKSAAPASALAQMGARLGGGTEAQIQALGRYFQQIGIAFQVMDDVLNLRGFDGDLKRKGEDIAEGKATVPVAKALTILPERERRELWRAVQARPTEPAEVRRIIDQIDACGALAACEQLAGDLVEVAWRELESLLPDSYYKLNLRVFGWYVLERHY
jgi:geranylgeranyl pyrophosphate synthase/predicted secreted hydrolase